VGEGNRVDFLKAYFRQSVVQASREDRRTACYLMNEHHILNQEMYDSFEDYQKKVMTTLLSDSLEVPEHVAALVVEFAGTFSLPHAMTLPLFAPGTLKELNAANFGIFEIDFGVLRNLWNKTSGLPRFNLNGWCQTKHPNRYYAHQTHAVEVFFFYKLFEVNGVRRYFALVVEEYTNLHVDALRRVPRKRIKRKKKKGKQHSSKVSSFLDSAFGDTDFVLDLDAMVERAASV